jgi:hypothetical protein
MSKTIMAEVPLYSQATRPKAKRARSKRPQDTAYQRRITLLEDDTIGEVAALRRGGLPYPHTDFIKVPKVFWIILASEPHAVSQVVFEVLLQTIGHTSRDKRTTLYGRRHWVRLTYRHFEKKGIMSKNNAREALNYAVEAGYLERRPHPRHSDDRRPLPTQRSRYEYAIRWDRKTLYKGYKIGCSDCP